MPSKKIKRTDERGHAYAGSQMHLQVWVNRHAAKLNARILSSLGTGFSGASIEWVSPIEKTNFREYRDGAFLRAVKLGEHRALLKDFWPTGGPVWDGLAMVSFESALPPSVLLVEAKSYPEEVHGNGCQATLKSDARSLIESSLAQTAQWLGVDQEPIWLGALYQSANRIAHTLFLRERIGLNAYMVNVCFTDDPRRPTSEAAWTTANNAFKDRLGISRIDTPWLVTVLVPAASRADLVADAT